MEIDEQDLVVEIFSNAVHGAEQHVQIRHRPTGVVGRGHDHSRIAARRAAMADLALNLLQRTAPAV